MLLILIFAYLFVLSDNPAGWIFNGGMIVLIIIGTIQEVLRVR